MVNKLNIREQTEKKEELLSPYAAKSKFSRGRLNWEEPCPIRTSFQHNTTQHKTHVYTHMNTYREHAGEGREDK